MVINMHWFIFTDNNKPWPKQLIQMVITLRFKNNLCIWLHFYAKKSMVLNINTLTIIKQKLICLYMFCPCKLQPTSFFSSPVCERDRERVCGSDFFAEILFFTETLFIHCCSLAFFFWYHIGSWHNLMTVTFEILPHKW